MCVCVFRARMNGWDRAYPVHIQAHQPPGVVQPTAYRYHSPPSNSSGTMTSLRRTTTPETPTHSLTPARPSGERRRGTFSEGGRHGWQDSAPVLRTRSPGERHGHGSQKNRSSDSSLQYYYGVRHASQPSSHSMVQEVTNARVHPKSPEAKEAVPRHWTSQASQNSYSSASQAGYLSPGVFEIPGYQNYLNSAWETQSVHSSQSDCTQSSEISEPTFKRPK